MKGKGAPKLRCLIVSTSQISFEKLTNVAEGKEKKYSDPLNYSLVCVVWLIFTGKKYANKPHFCRGNCKLRFNNDCFISVLKNAFIPRRTE